MYLCSSFVLAEANLHDKLDTGLLLSTSFHIYKRCSMREKSTRNGRKSNIKKKMPELFYAPYLYQERTED